MLKICTGNVQFWKQVVLRYNALKMPENPSFVLTIRSNISPHFMLCVSREKLGKYGDAHNFKKHWSAGGEVGLASNFMGEASHHPIKLWSCSYYKRHTLNTAADECMTVFEQPINERMLPTFFVFRVVKYVWRRGALEEGVWL